MFFSERNFPNNLLVPPSDDMVGDERGSWKDLRKKSFDAGMLKGEFWRQMVRNVRKSRCHITCHDKMKILESGDVKQRGNPWRILSFLDLPTHDALHQASPDEPFMKVICIFYEPTR